MEIFRMPMAGPARRDSTPGCRCVAGRPRCRMSALGTVVDGMSLSFLGIGMESLAEGLRTSEEQQGVRTDRLASCLPHQSSPKMPRATDAGSQRGRLQLRGGGQREQITVERRKWKIVRWRGRKGPRSKAAIKTPHKPHTLSVKIKTYDL